MFYNITSFYHFTKIKKNNYLRVHSTLYKCFLENIFKILITLIFTNFVISSLVLTFFGGEHYYIILKWT